MAVDACKSNLRFPLEQAFGERIEPGEKLTDNDLRNLFYGNYMEPDAEPKFYDEGDTYEKLEKLMKYYLREYNSFSSTPAKPPTSHAPQPSADLTALQRKQSNL